MRSLRLASVLAPLVLLAACGAAPSSSATPTPSGPPADVTPERIAEGNRLYNNGVCVNCHGVAGAGSNGGPALSDKTWLHGDGGYTQLVSIITDGFALADLMDNSYNKGMPSRGEDKNGKKFTNEEVKAVAAYVWSLTHKLPPKAAGA